jgi:WD40 repeat protein
MFNPIGSKATVCAFTLTPNIVITGHESGKVALFNVKTGEEVDNNERAHSDVVTDLQMSKDWTYCITSSKDKAARVRFLFLQAFQIARQTHRYMIPKISWSSRPSTPKLL